MLYQALSGDGYNQIKLTQQPKGKGESDGNIDDDEAPNVKFTDMPKAIWTNQDERYYMVDAFGHPYQYTKAASVNPTNPSDPGNVAVTVNNATYDLWSYGADDENTTARSLDSVSSETIKQASLKWIKNW